MRGLAEVFEGKPPHARPLIPFSDRSLEDFGARRGWRPGVEGGRSGRLGRREIFKSSVAATRNLLSKGHCPLDRVRTRRFA